MVPSYNNAYNQLTGAAVTRERLPAALLALIEPGLAAETYPDENTHHRPENPD